MHPQDSPFVGELHADRFKVSTLLQRAREGRLRIPHFQRPLRWKRAHELELLDSVLHRYPIGTLLLWSRPAPAEVVRFGAYSVDAPERTDALWIIDGQQRLNTLIGALLHPKGDDASRTSGSEIAFDLVNHRFVIVRGHVPATVVPVHRLADPVDTSKWARERQVDDAVHDAAQRVGSLIINYEIPTYTTSAQDDRVLRKVFTRANTTGVAMRPEEVFKALNNPLTGDATILTPLQEVASLQHFGMIDDKTVMKVLIAVSGISPRSARPALDAVDSMAPHVRPATDALSRAIDLLRDEASIPHAALLPGDLPLVVLSHFLHRFPDPTERTVERLVRWVWRACVADAVSMTNEHLHRSFRLVAQGDEHTAVLALLQALPATSPTAWPTSHVYNPTGRTTKIELCALASLTPLTLREDGTPTPVDLPALFDPDAPGLLRLRTGDTEVDRTTATRLLAPFDLHDRLATAPDDVLRSHAIDPADRDRLLLPEAIHQRADRLHAQVAAFLAHHARWGEHDDLAAFSVAFADGPRAA